MLSFHVLEFLWASIQSQDCCNQDWNMLRIPLWNQSLCVASGRPPINPNPIIITHPAHQFLYLFSLKCPKQCLPNLPKKKHSPHKITKHLKPITRALQKHFVYLLKQCAVWNLLAAVWYLVFESLKLFSHLIWPRKKNKNAPPSSCPRFKPEGSSAKSAVLESEASRFCKILPFLTPSPSILILFYHHFYCSNLTLHIGSRKGMMMQLHRLDFSRLPKIEI